MPTEQYQRAETTVAPAACRFRQVLAGDKLSLGQVAVVVLAEEDNVRHRLLLGGRGVLRDGKSGKAKREKDCKGSKHLDEFG